MRLFLDANVLFAAIYNPAGRCAALLELGAAGRCELVMSSYALEEARRNLALKCPDSRSLSARTIRHVSQTPEASPSLVRWAEAQGLPAKDAPILAAAIQAEANYLVTGDKRDFGPLFGRTLKGVRVVSPVGILTLLLDSPKSGA